MDIELQNENYRIVKDSDARGDFFYIEVPFKITFLKFWKRLYIPTIYADDNYQYIWKESYRYKSIEKALVDCDMVFSVNNFKYKGYSLKWVIFNFNGIRDIRWVCDQFSKINYNSISISNIFRDNRDYSPMILDRIKRLIDEKVK